jgi:hypothetical protein
MKKVLVITIAIMLLSSHPSAHAALGIDFGSSVAAGGLVENGGPSTFGAATGYTTVGWTFMPTTDLYLTRLGVYDADRDRVHSEQHLVGIWSADQSLLTSVTINEATMNVPETSPNGAMFHFVNTSSPLLLSAGQTYFVGATMYAGAVTGGGTSDFDSFAAFNNSETPVSINPNLIYLNSGYAINATNNLLFPASTFVTDYTIGANIDVTPVPIPGAAWLLGSGLIGLVGLSRKKEAAVA